MLKHSIIIIRPFNVESFIAEDMTITKNVRNEIVKWQTHWYIKIKRPFRFQCDCMELLWKGGHTRWRPTIQQCNQSIVRWKLPRDKQPNWHSFSVLLLGFMVFSFLFVPFGVFVFVLISNHFLNLHFSHILLVKDSRMMWYLYKNNNV